MIPGLNYIYACSKCGSFILRESIASGNTFHSIMYSDGKLVASMLPEFPILVKCKKCQSLLWLDKLTSISAYRGVLGRNPKWKNIERAKFIGIEDYYRALDESLAENEKDELYIRNRIWWLYNDRIRNNTENLMFTSEDDEIRWKDNCHKLLVLLDESNINQKLMKAEVNRNLGNFKQCLIITKSIKDEDMNWIKEQFIEACKAGDSKVMRLR